MTERGGNGAHSLVRRRNRRWGRVAGSFVPALALTLAAGSGAAGSSGGGAHPVQLVGNTPSEHDHEAADPSATASPSGNEHDADTHVDLPQSGQRWTAPDLVAQGALVRIETVADVYVALHHYHVEKYTYKSVTDPQAVSTGTFVNSRGLVITGKGALHDDAEQEKRFGTYGVNQAFVEAEFLKDLPDDPFSRTTITSRNKGRLADTPPTDPEINDRLQSCYNWETSHHCAVFVVMHQRVRPSVQTGDSASLEGLPQSDTRVAVLSTQPRGIAPLTLQLANPEPGAKYWVISSRGVNEAPLVGTGTLTDSERDPVSDEDLAQWSKEFGPLAEGAPVISDRGDLVAFLGTAEGSDELAAVSASHMSNDLRRFGLTRDSSPVDAQFQDGLELFEAKQFASAVPKLKAAVEATGGQRVARELLAQAEDQAGTAEDLSDEADIEAATADDDSGDWSPLAIGVFTGLVVLILIGAVVAIATARRHSWIEDAHQDVGATGDGSGEGDLGTDVPPSPAADGGGTVDAAAGLAPHADDAEPGSRPRRRGILGSGVWWSAGSRRPTADGPLAPDPGPAPAPAVAPEQNLPTDRMSPAAPNGHPSRPTTLFATGTTDPRPPDASAQNRPANRAGAPGAATPRPGDAPDDRSADPGEAPTMKRSATPAAPFRVAPPPAVAPSPDGLSPTAPPPGAPSPAASYPLPPGPATATPAAPRPDAATPAVTPPAPVRPSGGFCRQCGVLLSPGDRFCFSCGTPVTASKG